MSSTIPAHLCEVRPHKGLPSREPDRPRLDQLRRRRSVRGGSGRRRHPSAPSRAAHASLFAFVFCLDRGRRRLLRYVFPCSPASSSHHGVHAGTAYRAGFACHHSASECAVERLILSVAQFTRQFHRLHSVCSHCCSAGCASQWALPVWCCAICLLLCISFVCIMVELSLVATQHSDT
jgi:hypothetical protein